MNKESASQLSYPIKRSEELRVSRRQFAAFCGCSALALGAGFPVRKALLELPEATEPMTVAKDDELVRGGYKLFRYPSEEYPCILIRREDGEYAAFSQSCTHLMCPVHFVPATTQLVCPCHNGFFDARDGSVIAGPPQRPLPRYQVKVVDGEVIVGPAWEESNQVSTESV